MDIFIQAYEVLVLSRLFTMLEKIYENVEIYIYTSNFYIHTLHTALPSICILLCLNIARIIPWYLWKIEFKTLHVPKSEDAQIPSKMPLFLRVACSHPPVCFHSSLKHWQDLISTKGLANTDTNVLLQSIRAEPYTTACTPIPKSSIQDQSSLHMESSDTEAI